MLYTNKIIKTKLIIAYSLQLFTPAHAITAGYVKDFASNLGDISSPRNFVKVIIRIILPLASQF